MNLETRRMILQPLADEDFDTIYKIFTDEYIIAYLFDNSAPAKEQVKTFIQTSCDSFCSKSYGLWLLKLKNTDQAIGFAGLWHFFEEGQPQLLYALLPSYTGQGLAAEASRGIVTYCFDKLGFTYLDASCDTPNLSSQKTAQRIGMQKLKEEIVEGKPLTFYRIVRNQD